MFDIIIKNGSVIDGTGKPMFLGDIGVKNGMIAKIGELDDEKGEIEINAENKLVSPGFIDVTNHSDTFWKIFSNPDLESLVYQGITTIVGGNCGSSLAPLASAKTMESIQKWTDLQRINVNWLKLGEFFDFLGDERLSVNFATLIGHGTLRRGILGDDVRSLVPKELNFIEKMLRESMKNGALGLSTGLVYTHARLAKMEELVGLARIVEKYGGIYTTHIRDEADEVVGAVEEAIEIAKSAKVKSHISHLKAMGEKNWPKMDEMLALIERAHENGTDISFDVYPYTNTGSVLYTLLPSWVAEGGKRIMLHRLKDPSIRAKVVLEMKESGFEYDKVEIAASPLDKTLTRRKITEIAKSQEKDPEEAIVDILAASEGRVITSMEVLNGDNVRKAILHPLSAISSNGVGYSVKHLKTGESAHPRSFGTFIKVLEKYVLKEKVISFEDAIKKMTSFPADRFGIKKRGTLRESFFADIIILDKDKISSPSSKENPYQYAKGVEYALVNGKVVIKEGKYEGVRKGRIIKR